MYEDIRYGEKLFKAICKNSLKWVYGSYIFKKYLEKNQHYIYNNGNEILVWGNTVCQFTHCFDKNQNKIFENDLLKFHAVKLNSTNQEFSFISSIVFVNGKYILADEMNPKKSGSEISDGIIIGNKYDPIQ
jgi:hypothetical protein